MAVSQPDAPVQGDSPGARSPRRQPRRTYSLRTKLAAATTSAALALVMCEFAARITFPAPPRLDRQPQILYRADQQLGYVHVPSQQGWTDDGRVSINSLGLRGAELAPKEKDTWRLLVLGDSVTLGWGVNDERTYCHRLEELFQSRIPARKLEIINAGVSGYDSTQEAALLDRIGPVVQPDVVLVGFYWNDLNGRRTLTRAGSAGDDTLRMVPRRSWVVRAMRRSRALYCLRRATVAISATWRGDSWKQDILTGRRTDSLDRGWNKIQRDLIRVSEFAQRHGCAAGVVILPGREQVTGDYPDAQCQNRVEEIAQRLGMFVIDPLPGLRREKSRASALYLPYDVNHFSPRGHDVVAEVLCAYFMTEDILLQPMGPRLTRQRNGGSF